MTEDKTGDSTAAEQLSSRTGLTMPEWREEITRSIGRLHLIAADEESFRADMRAANLEDVHFFDMRTDAHTVVRDEELAAQAEGAYCKLSLQLSGAASLSQDGRVCHLEPGDLALYVTQRPYELSYPSDQHSLVVFFPQSYVHMTTDQIRMITATRVSRDEGLGRVAVPLFEQLAQNIDLLRGPHAMSLVRSALDMLVTVLSAESRASGRDLSENILLHQAIAFINENVHDPDLSPGKVASALYVSVRQLHSRFAQSHLTVASYIRMRRLEAIRQDLGDPLLAQESVHSISSRYGLFDSSYVSKALKAEFGESPSAYRTRILGEIQG